ncbi:hypothetical protein THRCLA_04448 [Thraustotheca clavata]|uniref:Ion transport domain-containing protein n=1 Tax=Thraustotheca clavata TaxID=74557 RepID=A0A1V9ZZ29_9STRA|nr:hypothetical protein THRCLA_04448 [Thraustotheca clavata]
MQLKWECFGRRFYYFQLFGSIILLMSTTIEISLVNTNLNNQTSVDPMTFCAYVFIWMELVAISIGAMLFSYFYFTIKNITYFCLANLISHGRDLKNDYDIQNFRINFREKPIGKKLIILLDNWENQHYFFEVLWCSIIFFLATLTSGLLMLALLPKVESPINTTLDQFLQINAIMQLTMASGFMLWELCQLRGSPYAYLTSFWNYSQLFTYIVVLLKPLGIFDEDLNWFNGLITFLLVHQKLAPIISMALEMLKDVRNFLIMYSVFQMGLTCIYYSLLQGQPGFTSFHTAFVSTYLIMFGLANSDVMLYTLEYPKQYVLTIFFMLHYLAVVIVLLNILIATMASTSQTILDQVEEHVRLNNIRSIVITELAIPISWRWKIHRQILLRLDRCELLENKVKRQSGRLNETSNDGEGLSKASSDNASSQSQQQINELLAQNEQLRKQQDVILGLLEQINIKLNAQS